MSAHIDSKTSQLLWESLYENGLNELRRRSSYGRILLTLIVLIEVVLPLVIYTGLLMLIWQAERQARLDLLFRQIIGGGFLDHFEIQQARVEATTIGISLLFFLASKALVGVMVLSSGWVDLASFRKAIRRKQLVRVSEKDEPRLYDLAYKIATEMSIDTSRLRIWLSLSPTSLPSVVDTHSINLLAPLGFANMAEDDPQSCEAILAHEFAHILHRDTGLFRRLHAVSRALYQVSLPITVFLLMTAPLKLTVVYLPMAAQYLRLATQAPAESIDSVGVSIVVLIALSTFLVMPILLEYAMYRWLVRSRLLSEDLADLFAAIRTTPGDLAQAIRRYVGPTIDQTHRPKQSRIERIEALTRSNDQESINELQPDSGARRIVALMTAVLLSYVLIIVLLSLLKK